MHDWESLSHVRWDCKYHKGLAFSDWRKFLIKPKGYLLFPDKIGCFQNRLDFSAVVSNKYADFLLSI